MPQDSEVLIIGGGVIGNACAYELAKRGMQVTLIDKSAIGHGCSYGNAGLLTPCLAMPLPMPGVIMQSLKWMFDPDGPLHIKPRPSLDLMRWLIRFVLCTRPAKAYRSVEALTQLAKYSLKAYKEMDAQQPDSFGLKQKGLLVVAQSQQGRRAALEHMDMIARYGIAGKYLDADAVRQLEPAVKDNNLMGGVLYPDEAHVEPLDTVEALAHLAKAHGANIHSDTEAFEFKVRGRRIEAVSTTHGWCRAEHIVLAAGIWSGPLAKLLDTRVPLMAGKGYAVTHQPLDVQPTMPVELTEKRVIATPRNDSVRFAGTLELVGHDESITARRVDALLRGVRCFLNVPDEPQIIEVWRGLRPCTADGMPIMGRAPRYDNLIISAGHQMMGMLTAPASACLVADLMTGEKPAFDPAPFHPGRF
jgi:D-amino-acid dehydrogenase